MTTDPSIEERLREAYRAAADAWTPSEASPMRWPSRARHRGHLIPLVAAVCVLLLVIAAFTLTSAHRSTPPADSPANTPTRSSGAPRFIVYVDNGGGGRSELRVLGTGTGTGTELSRTQPPDGEQFEQVAVADNDLTFIVSSRNVAARRVSLHMLRLSPAGRIEGFSPLPRLTFASEAVPEMDMAMSPDHAKIAYVAYRPHPDKAKAHIENMHKNIGRIEVVSIATGERRTWSGPQMSIIGRLSWSGSTLAFTYTRLSSAGGGSDPGLGVATLGQQLRTLDTAAPGKDLSAGKMVLNLPSSKPAVNVAWMLPDGQSMITDAYDPTTLSLYSVRTGRRIRTVLKAPADKAPADGEDPLLAQYSPGSWESLTADSTGRHLLAVPWGGTPMHIDLAGSGAVLPLPGGMGIRHFPPKW